MTLSRTPFALSFSLLLPLAAAGCSWKALSAKASKPLLADIVTSYRRESDLELVRTAAPGHLKMLDGLILGNPEDPELLETGCQLYAWYAFGILEDEMEIAPEGPAHEALKVRTKECYRRSREYGLRRLSLWKGSPERPPAQYFPSVDEVKTFAKSYGKGDVPALFWTSLSWMALTQLSLDEAQAISLFPSAGALAEVALALDPNYFYGGPHLLMGVYLGSRSKMLGGDLDRAMKEFDAADKIAGGRLLLVPLLKARYWAVSAQNRAQFESNLRRVAANDPSILPDERLSNELARRRANRYLAKADEWF